MENRNFRALRIAAIAAIAAVVAGAALSPLAAQVWEGRNQLLVPSTGASYGMGFGSVLATGDFNGDGRSDVAIGAPYHHLANQASVGRVEVHLGVAGGVAAAASLVINGTTAGQKLGFSLAAGDFDNDGRDELAVGTPGANLVSPSTSEVGAVEIAEMTAQGGWIRSAVWNQDDTGVLGVAEAGDHFGWSLAAGDFDADGYDDLAIGARDEQIGIVNYAGAVNVLYGGGGGLSATGNQVWYRGGGGLAGATHGDWLGGALAAGDFDGNGASDLAIGATGAETSDSGMWDGAVIVLFGQEATGLVAAGQQWIDREVLGLGDSHEGSSFGATLAAGDLSRTAACEEAGSCADDLVIGAPWMDSIGPTIEETGSVFLVYGSFALERLDLASAVEIRQPIYQGDGWTPPEQSDRFGESLAIGPLHGTSRADLAVGTPEEDFEALDGAGCVHVARDLTPGFSPVNDPETQMWTASAGLGAAPQASQQGFGAGLAIGDFDGDGWGDLAIGVPIKWNGPEIEAGAVQILFGALFADGFESAGTGNWSN